ncbi:hypothetical protein BV898_14939 [Hypsibius exemplaris]|uniref:Uncharacterized protein n=1 Tax=Hypsibius exemplaris TaxID=2072580 RepID=A0A9X6RJX9_HYPEX|nr:hypothetical protein BV898_14939 [Hypsibius exemplaris]
MIEEKIVQAAGELKDVSIHAVDHVAEKANHLVHAVGEVLIEKAGDMKDATTQTLQDASDYVIKASGKVKDIFADKVKEALESV